MRISAFVAAIFFSAAIGLAQVTPTPARSISTVGEAVVYVVPDEVVVSMGIETFHANLDQSKAQNDQFSATLLKAIKALGVDDRHVQANTLAVRIAYRDYSHPANGIEGYFANRTYSVTLKKITQLEHLIDAALKNGANQLLGIDYRASELRKFRDQARSMAIKAAKEKAVALAADLDCAVKKPRTISEGSFGYFDNNRWSNGNYNVQAQNSVQFAGEPIGESGQTMPLGQIGIRASVSVTFDME